MNNSINSVDPLVTAYSVPTGRTPTVEFDLRLTSNPAELSLTNLQSRSTLQQQRAAAERNLI